MTNKASTTLARMGQEPLLVAQGTEDLLTTYLTEAEAHEDFAKAAEVAAANTDEEFWGDGSDEFLNWLRPYNVDENGTLIVPVKGVLIHRMSYAFGSWMTGYGYLKKAIDRGMSDPQVNRIAFDIDSPGGMVAGNFELVEHMVELRGEKPMLAFANDHAFSAAYNIAAAADSITMTRSGGVGSVGVLRMHISYEGALQERGISVTLLHRGKYKTEGNPYENLSATAKSRMMAKLDRLYDEFTGMVASNRGLDEVAVRETEASTYDHTEALDIGFADEVGSMEEKLAAFKADQETKPMANTNTPAATTEGGQFTQAQIDAAVASATESAKAEGHAEGVSAERARINGIMGCEEAKTRPAAARMAISAGMSVDDAKASLADMPEETAAAPKQEQAPEQGSAPVGSQPTNFSENMSGTGVGAEPKPEATSGEEQDQSAQILGALSMVTGQSYGQKKSA